MSRDAIPVTILSGSLGAGKTTLLNHLLRSAGDRDVAVLVNDVGQLNVDAELVSARESAAEGRVAELSNGCICCELQDDLESAVVRLARNRSFDHLVVEASGISEPEPVARLFTTGSRAAARYEVGAVVAVVDARQFYDAFGGEGVPERRERAGEAEGADAGGNEGTDGDAASEPRPLSDLLVEQVEFADVVVLNKADLATDEELATVEELVAALRPDAEVVVTSFGEVEPDRLLGPDRFDPAAAAERAGWRVALAADEGDGGSGPGDDHDHDERDSRDERDRGRDHDHDRDHAHPEAVYGVTSFTFRRRRPFHPGRLRAFLADLSDAVVRAKGTCWVAGNDQQLLLGQAGPSVRVEAQGPWIAALPELDRELYRSNRRDLDWHEEWGDRRTELVVIGVQVDEGAVRSALTDCLLTDAEMDADWNGFDDPFPDEEGEALAVREPTPSPSA